jgi:hypothetical protein
MKDETPLQRGDVVLIRTDAGREVSATVTTASRNGRSLILAFDAMIGGWAGAMPVFLEHGQWAAIDGMPLTLTRGGRDGE